MKYIRNYPNLSAFTEPEEIIIGQKIGFYSIGGDVPSVVFYEAVDNGDGTYSASIEGTTLVFTDGLGFYTGDVSEMLKLELGDEVSGAIGDMHYSGYAVLSMAGEPTSGYSITIEEYNQIFGGELWFFTEELENFNPNKIVLNLKEYEVKEIRQNTITEFPDILCVNKWGTPPSALKVRDNGDGTYTEIMEGGQTGRTNSGDGIYVISSEQGISEYFQIILGTEEVVFRSGGWDLTGFTYTCPGHEIPDGFCNWRVTGSGTLYTGTTENAIDIHKGSAKFTITHPYTGGTEYQFLAETPGVGYIKDIGQVAYQEEGSTVKGVRLYFSGTTTLACTLPIENNTLTITQEELRKLAITFMPDGDPRNPLLTCYILLPNVLDYHISRDEEGIGYGLDVNKRNNNINVRFDVCDIPGWCNDRLEIQLPTSSTTEVDGEIAVYYTNLN